MNGPAMPDGTASTELLLDPSDPRALRDAFGRFATGVTLVTTLGPEGPVGFVANSFSSVSLDPPLVLWSPARASSRFAIFTGARHFAIHVLEAGQRDWVARFARGGAGFAGLDHSLTSEGLPALSGALARFDCARHAVHDGGDHAIILGRVLRMAVRAGKPLVFSQGRYGSFAG
ncbi:flavin reductase family protein [Tabrizicola caldifontis]|uniref:flavin reductase family protein n=1 Tax=Tabrizicola caldifontis TaxID=2528036 RepID=UPI001F10A44F|nr:flavin reductase family protein [Rhodobacter sp. YIM 73028]